MSGATNQDAIISSTMKQAASIMRSARSLLESTTAIMRRESEWEDWADKKETNGVAFSYADPADVPIPNRLARHFRRRHSKIKGLEQLSWFVVDFGEPLSAGAAATCSFCVAWVVAEEDTNIDKAQLSFLHRQAGLLQDGVAVHYLNESEIDEDLRKMGFLVALSVTKPLSTITSLDSLKRELVDQLLYSDAYQRFGNAVEYAPKHLRKFWNRLAEAIGKPLNDYDVPLFDEEFPDDISLLGSECVSITLYPKGQKDWWFAIEKEELADGCRLYVGIGHSKKQSLYKKGGIPNALKSLYPDVQQEAEESATWIGWKYLDLGERAKESGPLSLAWAAAGDVDQLVNFLADQVLAELNRVKGPLLAQAFKEKGNIK